MMLLLLKDLTATYQGRVITVGSSSGGYAAILFGILLGAKRVFAFSSQFNIDDKLCELSARIKYDGKYKYSNILKMCHDTITPIYYFYPCLSAWDIEQSSLIQQCNSIHCFPILSSLHGKAVYANNIPNLLNMNEDDLVQLISKFENKEVSPLVFSLYIVGIKKSICAFLKNMLKPIYYKIKDFYRNKQY